MSEHSKPPTNASLKIGLQQKQQHSLDNENID